MDLMFRKTEFFDKHWSCENYSTAAIPVDEKTHPIYGLFLFVTSVIFMILYVPCIYAMTRPDLFANSCYKIMVQMACCDLITIPITGIISGYWSITGTMYCDAPRINHFLGTLLLICWMAYSWAAVILAINRICAMTDRLHWFEGNRVMYWLLLPCSIGLFSGICGVPVAYNSMFGAWYFNPFIESVVDDEGVYAFHTHTADNVIFSFTLPTIYIIFFLKNHQLIKNRSHGTGASKKEYSLFLQCVIISGCITMAAFGYVFMQFLPLPLWVSTICHGTWLLVQGSPPIVYLTMNKSVRSIVLNKINKKVMPSVSTYSNNSNTMQTRP